MKGERHRFIPLSIYFIAYHKVCDKSIGAGTVYFLEHLNCVKPVTCIVIRFIMGTRMSMTYYLLALRKTKDYILAVIDKRLYFSSFRHNSYFYITHSFNWKSLMWFVKGLIRVSGNEFSSVHKENQLNHAHFWVLFSNDMNVTSIHYNNSSKCWILKQMMIFQLYLKKYIIMKIEWFLLNALRERNIFSMKRFFHNKLLLQGWWATFDL